VRELIATIVNGEWVPIVDGHSQVTAPNSQPAQIMPIDAVDRVVAHLSEVIALAQGMSATDQRRIREFVAAAHSLLSATTVLPTEDQKIFETALREAARRI
jgi:hypothetical protein